MKKIFLSLILVLSLLFTFVACDLGAVTPSGNDEETSAKQEETPDKQEETTNKQEETTAKQEETTAKQEETTAKQEETTAKQEETTTKQEQTTSNQEQSTTNQEQSTTNQEQSTTNQEQSTANQEQTTDKIESETQPNDPGATDKNINALVGVLGNEVSLYDIIKDCLPESVEMPSPEDIYNILKQVELEATIDYTSNNERVNGYVGVKDCVAYINLTSKSKDYTDKIEGYAFVEKDLSMVGMNIDEDGTINAEIESGLKDTFAQIGNVDINSMLDQYANPNTFAGVLINTKLPALTAEMIEFKDGKYFVKSDYYMTIAEFIVNKIAEQPEADVSKDEADAMLEQVESVLKMLNINLYFEMDKQEICGVGLEFNPSADFVQGALGLEALSVTVHADANGFDINANFAFDGKEYKNRISLDIIYNIFNGVDSVELDMSLNFPSKNSYEAYNSNVYEKDYFYYTVEKFTSMAANVKLDLSALDGSGEILSMTCKLEQTSGKAYKENYSENGTEEVYDESLTQLHKNDVFNLDYAFNIDYSIKNKSLTCKLNVATNEITSNANGGDPYVQADRIDCTVTIDGQADNFVEPSDEVIDAKNEALANADQDDSGDTDKYPMPENPEHEENPMNPENEKTENNENSAFPENNEKK